MSEKFADKFAKLSPEKRALFARYIQDKNNESFASKQRNFSISEGDQYRLANGLVITHHSNLQTEALYKEIFEEEVYLKHGITLSNNSCIFDAGANIGMFTIFAFQKCKNPLIYAFEPLPPNFKLLQANITLNHLDAKFFNYGLSNKNTTTAFTYYPFMAAFSGCYPQEDKELSKSIVVNWLQTSTHSNITTQEIDKLLDEYFYYESYACHVRTISEVINEHNIQCIDLLKIDVEKSEYELLSGIRDEDWKKIKQISMEVHNKELLERIIPLLTQQRFQYTIEEKFVTDNNVRYAYMLYARRT